MGVRKGINKSIIAMGKSKIWHSFLERFTAKRTEIYLLDNHKNIYHAILYDETTIPRFTIDMPRGGAYYVAWAYAEDILNL